MSPEFEVWANSLHTVSLPFRRLPCCTHSSCLCFLVVRSLCRLEHIRAIPQRLECCIDRSVLPGVLAPLTGAAALGSLIMSSHARLVDFQQSMPGRSHL
jgi:hypothetical protein